MGSSAPKERESSSRTSSTAWRKGEAERKSFVATRRLGPNTLTRPSLTRLSWHTKKAFSHCGPNELQTGRKPCSLKFLSVLSSERSKSRLSFSLKRPTNRSRSGFSTRVSSFGVSRQGPTFERLANGGSGVGRSSFPGSMLGMALLALFHSISTALLSRTTSGPSRWTAGQQSLAFWTRTSGRQSSWRRADEPVKEPPIASDFNLSDSLILWCPCPHSRSSGGS